jgi:5-methyltetrahydropteroyltriglutamate--homocysteine methyltransferase
VVHRNITGKLLPVTMAGAWPRPRWLKRELLGGDIRQAWFSTDWWEEWTDALKGCLVDQATAGLDIVGDGELYDYQAGGMQWPAYFIERIGGVFGNPLRAHPHTQQSAPDNLFGRTNEILHEVDKRTAVPPLTERATRGPWRFAEINRIARDFSSLPVKAAFIAPQLAAGMIIDEHYPAVEGVPVSPQLLLDLCDAVNEELRDLEASGCQIFQCDELPIHMMTNNTSVAAPPEAVQLMVESYNRMIAGIGESMQIWVHLCWGNPAGQRPFGTETSFAGMMEQVFAAKFDVLNIEFLPQQHRDIELLAEVPKDRGVALGIVDHRTTRVQHPDELADVIRKVVKYIEPDRLYLTSACGLMHQPRLNAYYKLKALADAARIVREELTGVREEVTTTPPQAVAAT